MLSLACPLFESGSVAHCYMPCWLTLTFLGVYCSPLIFSKDGMTDAYYHSWLYVGTGDPNSGLEVFIASALSTELSL